MKIKDNYNRTFPYLRLSITDICNFRCNYCLPNGYKCASREKYLSLDEIRNLINGFVALGVKKVRLTGGEPTIRQDIFEIIEILSSYSEIEEIALTTNGYKLPKILDKLADSKLKKINISVDSLDNDKFYKITKHNKLEIVLDGLQKALDKKLITSMNVVLLKDINDCEIDDFLEFAKHREISVRFIELMRTNDNLDFFNKHYMNPEFISKRLLKNGWKDKARCNLAGPAIKFTHPDYRGSIGIISPYMEDFCKGCNRLRVSSRGELHLCLFGDKNSTFSLRPYLQKSSQKDELVKLVTKTLSFKKETHFLKEEYSGTTNHLSLLGG